MRDVKPIGPFAYRPDIDGLRAFAVLAVVFFHLGFERLEGGFIGVDVFFVVSGFLITGIIEPKIKAGSFSLKDFYLRRIRRLIPPSLVTVAGTLLACAFVFTPDDLINMAKSAIAAAFSVSNILFFTEAGYWDEISELKPLLHTWSLGVEEQFYLLWPALVIGLVAVARNRVALGLAVLTAIGIALSHWMLVVNPSAAFFLLPARFFEFGLGAVFLFASRTMVWQRMASLGLRTALLLGGLAVLVATVLIFDGETPFPGLPALVPCLATGAVLLAGTKVDESPFPVRAWLLENPVAVWLGRVSYSLYLVHWPVVALLRYERGLELSAADQVLAAGLIMALTVALYYGVEKRISARAGMKRAGVDKPARKASHGRFATGMLAGALAVSGVATHAVATDGWTWRYPDIELTPAAIEAGKKARFSISGKTCRIDAFAAGQCERNVTSRILVYGNSHEPDGINVLSTLLDDRNDVQLLKFAQVNGCKIVEAENGDFVGSKKTCAQRFEALMDPDVVRRIDVIVYAANQPFSGNKRKGWAIVQRVKAKNPDIKIVVLGGYINTKTNCATLANVAGSLEACVAPENIQYVPGAGKAEKYRDSFLAEADLYIDVGDLMCDGERPQSCELRADNGEPFMYDTSHRSLGFSQTIARRFAERYPDAIDALLMR